jgi:ABC-2 type transport system ATP-binding protein
VRALDGVDLEIAAGEVFGLLGANGAGKTTLVKLLLGLSRPTAGTARVRGLDPLAWRSRRRLGYLPEGHRFPGYLTANAALRLFGRLAELPEAALDRRVPELVALVGLADRASDRIGRYSKGMTQRLGLACALLDEPEVLFLDEPTDGVDPVGRRHIRDVLLSTRARGTTIFINSHLLSEVERTCDRVAILHRGKIVRAGSVEALTRRSQRFRIRVGGDHPPTGPFAIAGLTVTAANGALDVSVESLEALNRLLDELRAASHLIAEVSAVRSDLEDVFVAAVDEASVPATDGSLTRTHDAEGRDPSGTEGA